ncbi:hypothetical protein [Lysobacter gummosus]
MLFMQTAQVDAAVNIVIWSWPIHGDFSGQVQTCRRLYAASFAAMS